MQDILRSGVYTQYRNNILNLYCIRTNIPIRQLLLPQLAKWCHERRKGVLRPAKSQKKIVKLIKLRISAWNDIKCNFNVFFFNEEHCNINFGCMTTRFHITRHISRSLFCYFCPLLSTFTVLRNQAMLQNCENLILLIYL